MKMTFPFFPGPLRRPFVSGGTVLFCFSLSPSFNYVLDHADSPRAFLCKELRRKHYLFKVNHTYIFEMIFSSSHPSEDQREGVRYDFHSVSLWHFKTECSFLYVLFQAYLFVLFTSRRHRTSRRHCCYTIGVDFSSVQAPRRRSSPEGLR